jgi:hypothetical protein
MNVGDRVKIGRDETRFPSRGTWPRFRGKTGTVVEINYDHQRPHLTEYGVQFGKVRKPHSRTGSIVSGSEVTTWFKSDEIRGLAPQRPTDSGESTSEGSRTGELLAHA